MNETIINLSNHLNNNLIVFDSLDKVVLSIGGIIVLFILGIYLGMKYTEDKLK